MIVGNADVFWIPSDSNYFVSIFEDSFWKELILKVGEEESRRRHFIQRVERHLQEN